MDAYSITFDGRVLDRGFWLYVVVIDAPEGRRLYYVGRTGDSSSANASSPFSRIGQHLDCRPHAKGNALLRNLRREGVRPRECKMEMIAVGPLFPEEIEFTAHRLVCDRVAALEKALAEVLREHGTVIGKHLHSCSLGPTDCAMLAEVRRLVEARLREGGAA